MPWEQLQRHFARGVILKIDSDLDLIEVAMQFVRDDREGVAPLLDSGQVTPANDDDALKWHNEKAELWTVVAAPWVLVQP
jgi:hypothetical protein